MTAFSHLHLLALMPVWLLFFKKTNKTLMVFIIFNTAFWGVVYVVKRWPNWSCFGSAYVDVNNTNNYIETIGKHDLWYGTSEIVWYWTIAFVFSTKFSTKKNLKINVACISDKYKFSDVFFLNVEKKLFISYEHPTK